MKLIERMEAAITGKVKQILGVKPTAPQPAPKQGRPAAASEPYVYVTAHGKRFHWDPACPAILQAFNEGKAVRMALSKARAAGYTACDRCCYDYLH